MVVRNSLGSLSGEPEQAGTTFAYGLRNPFRLAINGDANNPTVYIGDVGWTQWEEINRATGGENFGWPAFEGGEDGESFQTGRYEDLSSIQDFYATNPDVTAPTWALSLIHISEPTRPY